QQPSSEPGQVAAKAMPGLPGLLERPRSEVLRRVLAAKPIAKVVVDARQLLRIHGFPIRLRGHRPRHPARYVGVRSHSGKYTSGPAEYHVDTPRPVERRPVGRLLTRYATACAAGSTFAGGTTMHLRQPGSSVRRAYQAAMLPYESTGTRPLCDMLSAEPMEKSASVTVSPTMNRRPAR